MLIVERPDHLEKSVKKNQLSIISHDSIIKNSFGNYDSWYIFLHFFLFECKEVHIFLLTNEIEFIGCLYNLPFLLTLSQTTFHDNKPSPYFFNGFISLHRNILKT